MGIEEIEKVRSLDLRTGGSGAILNETANVKLTSEQLIEARDWIKDCKWEDIYCDEDVDEMSDAQVEAGIAKYYDGGIQAFIQSSTEKSYKPQTSDRQRLLT